MVSLSGAVQLRVTLSWVTWDVDSPVGAAGGSPLTRWVAAVVHAPL